MLSAAYAPYLATPGRMPERASAGSAAHDATLDQAAHTLDRIAAQEAVLSGVLSQARADVLARPKESPLSADFANALASVDAAAQRPGMSDGCLS